MRFSVHISSYCMTTEIIVMLKKEADIKDAPRWYCKVDQNLLLLFCLQNSFKLHKIPNTTG